MTGTPSATSRATIRVPHGTTSAYRKRKCRCDTCRARNAANQARQRATRDPLPPGDPRHGTLNGYTNYRCRCGPCAAAKRGSR
jgi:hypothetical protein